MNDGREFTDFRSSQIREEVFRYNNCLASENETRAYRTENAERILDSEHDHLIKTKYCFPRQNCYHTYPRTLTTTKYNNAEIQAYNGKINKPSCKPVCHHYRATLTKKSKQQYDNCPNGDSQMLGYPQNKQSKRCSRTNRLLPDNLYMMPYEK